jgi:hypothetical protein
MATRSQVKFSDRGVVAANIYVHYDGYPDGEAGRLNQLQRFFKSVKENCGDTRFHDAEYLAAKYIVWYATEYLKDEENPKHALNFSGIGVCLEDHGDIEYTYLVDCDHHDPETGFPTVDYKKR